LRKEDCEFYLEAKEARDQSKEQEALKNRVNQVYDSLNKTKSPNFFLNIETLLLKSNAQPSTREAIKKLEMEMTKHDPDIVAEKLQSHGLHGTPKISYEDINLKLIVSLIPKDPLYRIDGGRAIGIYPFESVWGGSEESIKDSFARKAQRYGKLDKPYFICINAIGILGNGDLDVKNAIWGSLAWGWSTNPMDRNEGWELSKDGIFLDQNGPKYQNVSGLLVNKVMEFNVPISPYWFVKHPFSTNESSFELFDLSHQFVENRQIKKREGKTIGEILGIRSTWLED
jgi:hypothetical protein